MQFHFPENPKVFFFGILFIPNTVFRVNQIYASRTIGAISARINERAIPGIFAFLAEFRVVTISAIHAFVTQFAFVEPGRIAAIHDMNFAVVNIHRIFRVRTAENHIGVFRIRHPVGIRAVSRESLSDDRHPWHLVLKFENLFKKGTRGIVIHSVFLRVPHIRIPNIRFKNRKHCLFRIHAENIFAGKIALPLIQNRLAGMHKPPKQPALRTPSRRRDFDFLVEIEVLRLYGKVLFAVLACRRH